LLFREFQFRAAPSVGKVDGGEAHAPSTLLSYLLAVSSLTFLFAVGFPWQHHNESLVWEIDLQKLSFWSSLLPRPVTHVASYRPLGIALAWLTFKASGGGLWLQQLINYVFTVFAWLLALGSVRDRLSFAWLSFICGAVFFSGYIYLFHLHGVFYGPLLAFIAWLLVQDERLAVLTWPKVFFLLSIATVAALFHTFAYLLLAAFLVGRCIQDLIGHRAVHSWHPARRATSMSAAAFGALMSGCGILLLTYSSRSVGPNYALAGMMTSYELLEVNSLARLTSALLAVLACITLQGARLRAACIVLALVVSLALWGLHLPVVLAWIGICFAKSLFERRVGLAFLIMASAALPVATGTGSPTYALMVLLPACKATVDGFEAHGVLRMMQRGVGVAAIVGLLLAYIAIRSATVPPLDRLVSPLLSEREKTDQMMQMLAWLDANPGIKGDLRLCQPADYPVHSATARERRYRAPTDAFSLTYYLKGRYGERLVQGIPLWLCFGGENAGTAQLHTIEGRWAGKAALQRQ
jgi:hypothetical protein